LLEFRKALKRKYFSRKILGNRKILFSTLTHPQGAMWGVLVASCCIFILNTTLLDHVNTATTKLVTRHVVTQAGLALVGPISKLGFQVSALFRKGRPRTNCLPFAIFFRYSTKLRPTPHWPRLINRFVLKLLSRRRGSILV
jgi:hypothetical protein